MQVGSVPRVVVAECLDRLPELKKFTSSELFIPARRPWKSREHWFREDIEVTFEEAQSVSDYGVGRGPYRYHVEIHPEQVCDFVDHPWVTRVCAGALGPDCEIVELGFDVPFAGAVNQPWHRDFPAPEEIRREGRLIFLAFNLTAVDTEEDLGPLGIAVGTQFDDGTGFDREMFPAKDSYAERAVRKYPGAATCRPARRGPSTARRRTSPKRLVRSSSWASTRQVQATPNTTTWP